MTAERFACVEFYRDAKSRWRWRYVSYGKVMADSGQSYTRRLDALTAAQSVVGENLFIEDPSGVSTSGRVLAPRRLTVKVLPSDVEPEP